MTTFSWLLIAHFVGDWMLQNDWMARNKGASPYGVACLVHCLLYTSAVGLVYAATTAPQSLTWERQAAFVAAIFISHWWIDGWRLSARWGALLGQSSGSMVRIVVDQTMHILALAFMIALLSG